MYNQENTNYEQELFTIYVLANHNDKFFDCDLEVDDFAFDITSNVFSFIAKKIKYNLPVDLADIHKFLKDNYSELDCDNFIKQIKLSSIYPFNLQKTVKTLRDLSDKRKIKAMILDECKNLSNGSKNAQEIKESIVEGLDRIKDFKYNSKTVSIKDSLIKTFEKKEVEVVYTGFNELDKITTGFEEGSFVVLAAGTGMGKSAIASNIAINVARQGKGVAIFSLEMNHEQITRRMVASLASLNLTKLKYDNLTNQYEFEAFRKAVDEMAKLPILINDDGFLTLLKLRNEIKNFVKKNKVKLVIIDYVQLINHITKGNEVERITQITNYLKALAMEFKIVVIGLSQLSRSVINRENKKPTLSDLRSSGSIEQDANCVLFVFRPEYYLINEEPADKTSAKYRQWQDTMASLVGVSYVIVAKNRDGGLGEVKFKFDKEFTRFTEVTNNDF